MKYVIGAIVAFFMIIFILAGVDCYNTGGRPVRGWFGGIECIR